MSAGNLTKKCLWIKRPASIGVDAIYCGQPVTYTMAWDGDEPNTEKVRWYNDFCQLHLIARDKMMEDENDES